MDSRATMIIAKGEPITTNVISCEYNDTYEKWEVTFRNGKSFRYNKNNLLLIRNSESLDPQMFQIRRGGEQFDNVVEIQSFKLGAMEFWRVRFSNGDEREYKCSELQIGKSALQDNAVKRVFDYLCKVAGVISVHGEDDKAFLLKQYSKIDYLDENTAAASYMNPEKYNPNTGLDATAPIFPFGCNESQFKAVRNALENKISVIEGPPGTGKTQTILNIVANLILQDKTVQVVSNNNSAIDNILEKLSLPQYNIGFIAARLGKQEKISDFISGQDGFYPDFSKWNSEEFERPEFFDSVREKSKQLQKVFHDKNRLAVLRQEESQIRTEEEHLDILIGDSEPDIIHKNLESSCLLDFLQEYQDIEEGLKKPGLIYKIYRRLTMGISINRLMSEDPSKVINGLQKTYYRTRLKEIDTEISHLLSGLGKINTDKLIEEFTEISLNCLRSKISKKYCNRTTRKVFEANALWRNPDDFMDEYPIVLSTTYTSRSSLGKNAQYDYAIIDEASQVDVATGALALSCASNAVVVGDTKQLPNVVTREQKREIEAFSEHYKIPKEYDFAEFSFLSSLCAVMNERIPRVILYEHYRCHPQIIGFCNQKFYDGKLVVMTESERDNALRLVTTVAGNHKRERMNQRQIDVICNEVLPGLEYRHSEIGIISPYRNQIKELNKELINENIEIDTVHKFQGREKDVIIFSTVDDIVTEFSDDPNLLNVAVSRAKKKLIIISSEEEQPVGSNIGDLIGYIRYNNCEVSHSEISSVFDYLYEQYEKNRREYLKKHKRISEYDSENLMYALICEELESREPVKLGVICHQPLQLLFTDQSKMTSDEKRFVNTGLSHLDFLIYNKVSKEPLLAIEVDGYYYHREESRQEKRDQLKNHILKQYGLPLIRFKTNGSGEKQKLKEKLNELLNMSSVDNME